MEKLQYDSFYKFLISLGIVLIALPIIGYFTFLQILNQSFITQSQYLEFSDFSIQLLEKRNQFYFLFFNYAPILFLICFLLGINLFIYGAYKWRILQKEFDAQTFLTTKEKQVNLEKMSVSEILEKQIEEATEKMENSKDFSIVHTIHMEELCYYYLKNCLPDFFNLQQNMKVMNMYFDVIASSSNKDILYEIKYYKEMPLFDNFKKSVYQFESNCSKYSIHISKQIESIFLIILPEENYYSFKEKIIEYIKLLDLKNVKIDFLAGLEIGEDNE